MGCRGKVGRAGGGALDLTMPDIAGELGVCRSSVSLWTRDVAVELAPRRLG